MIKLDFIKQETDNYTYFLQYIYIYIILKCFLIVVFQISKYLENDFL